jgi:hypothetical protein
MDLAAKERTGIHIGCFVPKFSQECGAGAHFEYQCHTAIATKAITTASTTAATPSDVDVFGSQRYRAAIFGERSVRQFQPMPLRLQPDLQYPDSFSRLL